MIHLGRDVEALLLGRTPNAELTDAEGEAFRNQRVLITGGAGSVGFELARGIAACAPQCLTLFDHAEYSLFQVERALRDEYPGLPLDCVLGDVSRRADIRAACLAARPTVVYHAAAYKHVAIAERAIVAAARVNVLGTAEAIRAAGEADARFLLVSSDKAAQPRSVMGATKRMAELLASRGLGGTLRPIAVRFGNVLGSRGSVLEVMIHTVRAGRSVPVTAPDATRFFITAQEAISLIIKADLIGRAGEVFWFKVGDPLRIGDLASRVITYATPAGTPRADVQIIGLRPGEKLHEQLTSGRLEMHPTTHRHNWVARELEVRDAALERAVEQIRRACATGDATGVLEALRLAVSDYEPSDYAIEAARSASAAISVPESTRSVPPVRTLERAADRRTTDVDGLQVPLRVVRRCAD